MRRSRRILEGTQLSALEALPDELLRRIAADCLGALETLERAQLQTLSRRMREAIRGVEWGRLDLGEECFELAALDERRRANVVRRLARRASAGFLRGVRTLALRVGGTRADSAATVELLAGLSRSSPGVERVEAAFEACAAAGAGPLPEFVAGLRAFPALRELHLDLDRRIALDLDWPAPSPPVLALTPPRSPLGGLRALRLRTCSLSAAEAAALARGAPQLRSLALFVDGGAALRPLALLAHLEELELDMADAAFLAALASGPAAACVRSLTFAGARIAVPGPSLETVARLQALEVLRVGLGASSAGGVAPLGALPRLRDLSLRLLLGGARDAECDASLVREVAAAVATAPALQFVDIEARLGRSLRDAAAEPLGRALASLAEAARPRLRRWAAAFGQAASLAAPVAAALAPGGPWLEAVELEWHAEGAAQLAALPALEALAAGSPRLRLAARLLVPQGSPLAPQARPPFLHVLEF